MAGVLSRCMKRRSTSVPRCFALIASAILLGTPGCTTAARSDPATTTTTTTTPAPATTPSAIESSPPTTTASSTTPSSAASTVSERCPDPYPGTSGPDCFAESDGYRVTKQVRDDRAVVTVQRAGVTVQTLTVPVDGYTGSGALLLRHLTAGAAPDVLVSTTTSGAHGQNSTWSVWHSSHGAFTPIGTLYGNEFWDAGSGLVGSYSSGGGWSVTFSTRADGGRLRSVAEVGRSDTAGVRDPKVPECTVTSREAGAPADPCALAIGQAHAHGLKT